MNILDKPIEKTLLFHNYIQRYPSYKDFFHNVIEKDETLYKSWIYTYLPVEEFDLRNDVKKYIQDDTDLYIYDRLYEKKEVLEKHKKQGHGEFSLSIGIDYDEFLGFYYLYYDYLVVKNADSLFLNKGNVQITIKELREIIGKVERREYTEGKKKISEVKRYLFLPFLIQTDRTIELNGKIKMEDETEFLFPPDFDEEKLKWEKFIIGEVLQRYKRLDLVYNVNYSVAPEEHSMIFSYKGKKIELPFNLLHRQRYYPLIVSILQKYKGRKVDYEYCKQREDEEDEEVEELSFEKDDKKPKKKKKKKDPDNVSDKKDVDLGLGNYTFLERHEFFGLTIAGFKNLALEYNPKEHKKHGLFPGYLKARLTSFIGDAWKGETTEALYKERTEQREWDEKERKDEDRTKEPDRKLKVDIDYSAGSLDKEMFIGQDTEGGGKTISRIDLVTAKDKGGKSKIISSRQQQGYEAWEEKERVEDSLIDELDGESDSNDFQDLIDTLPDPIDKMITEAIFIENKLLTQIAKELKISQPAVSQRYAKILKHFEKYFNKFGKPKK